MSYSSNEAKTPIHVALAVYDPKGTYSQHAGVVMTSIFENTKSPVVVHILHDETLTKDNHKKFIRTAEKFNQGVALIDVSEYVENLDSDTIRDAKHWSVGALFRLFIPDILDVDRVIYLDCDVVVNLDIQKLWNIDLEGNCLGGFGGGLPRSFLIPSYADVCNRLNGCPSASYINSGVLLMDLKQIRGRLNLFQAAMKWRARHKHSNRCIDQDILNSLFFGSIKLINDEFPKENNISGAILHLAGPAKPWNALRGIPTDKLYWKMYLRSAWGERMTMDDLVDLLCDTALSSSFMHTHTKHCYHQIGIRLFRDIFHPEFFETIWTLLQEFGVRIRQIFSPRREC